MATQKIPAVQLPVGSVPNPQSGTSKDTLDLMKQSVQTPQLPVGAQQKPVYQTEQANEILGTQGVSTTAPIAAVPTSTAQQATTTTPTTTQTITDPAAMAASNYAATTVGTAPTMTAAQGTVTAPMTAQTGQIASDATVQ